jgi:hypothetical protein
MGGDHVRNAPSGKPAGGDDTGFERITVRPIPQSSPLHGTHPKRRSDGDARVVRMKSFGRSRIFPSTKSPSEGREYIIYGGVMNLLEERIQNSL